MLPGLPPRIPTLNMASPITGVIISATGEQVLYTQQVRFRKTPDNKIVIDPLGSMLYTPGTPANFSFNTPACRVYGDTGFHICYAFLQAYGIHGSMLGVPLSDPEVMNGRIVQAFEYGWLEWRPENPPNQRVTFVDLGRIAYDLWEHKADKGALESSPSEIPDCGSFAFVERSVLPAGMDQTLTVIARTPDFQTAGKRHCPGRPDLSRRPHGRSAGAAHGCRWHCPFHLRRKGPGKLPVGAGSG